MATKDKINKDLDKLDVELHQYEKSFTDIKKNHSIILGRCEAVTKATDSTSILNLANTLNLPMQGSPEFPSDKEAHRDLQQIRQSLTGISSRWDTPTCCLS